MLFNDQLDQSGKHLNLANTVSPPHTCGFARKVLCWHCLTLASRCQRSKLTTFHLVNPQTFELCMSVKKKKKYIFTPLHSLLCSRSLSLFEHLITFHRFAFCYNCPKEKNKNIATFGYWLFKGSNCIFRRSLISLLRIFTFALIPTN